jgi:hypothetical protein
MTNLRFLDVAGTGRAEMQSRLSSGGDFKNRFVEVSPRSSNRSFRPPMGNRMTGKLGTGKVQRHTSKYVSTDFLEGIRVRTSYYG